MGSPAGSGGASFFGGGGGEVGGWLGKPACALMSPWREEAGAAGCSGVWFLSSGKLVLVIEESALSEVGGSGVLSWLCWRMAEGGGVSV